MISVTAPQTALPQKLTKLSQEVTRFAVCASSKNTLLTMSDADDKNTTPGNDVEKITTAVKAISLVLNAFKNVYILSGDAEAAEAALAELCVLAQESVIWARTSNESAFGGGEV